MKSVYRVIAISRETGKQIECYIGSKAIEAVTEYEKLISREMFIENFKVVLQKMRPETVMESD